MKILTHIHSTPNFYFFPLEISLFSHIVYSLNHSSRNWHIWVSVLLSIRLCILYKIGPHHQENLKGSSSMKELTFLLISSTNQAKRGIKQYFKFNYFSVLPKTTFFSLTSILIHPFLREVWCKKSSSGKQYRTCFQACDHLKVDIEPDLLCILFIFFLDDSSSEAFETCNHISFSWLFSQIKVFI